MTRDSISRGRFVHARMIVTSTTSIPVANRQNIVVCRIASCASTAFCNCETTMTPAMTSGVIHSTRRRIDCRKLTPPIAQTRVGLNRSTSPSPITSNPTTTITTAAARPRLL
jgi:hypothetical protein